MSAYSAEDARAQDIEILKELIQEAQFSREGIDASISQAKYELDKAMEVVEEKRKRLDDCMVDKERNRMQTIAYGLAMLRAKELLEEGE